VEKSFTNEIYAYALENAIEHGKTMANVVLPKLFQHGLKKESIKDVISEINKVVSEVNSMSSEDKIKLIGNYKKFLKEKVIKEKGLKELPNVRKNQKLVFRMAPFPSGPLHIGNTKTFLLNALYAEKYKGKILLVIDDTIGSEEKALILDAYHLIPEAFDYLKVKYKKPIIYKSDRLNIYYKYAEELIKKNKAYVCSCSQEALRENRAKKIECACRLLKVADNLERWKKMFNARQGEYVLRIKTDMKHPNPAFRDRVLFRISEREHPRVGKKYKVWPLLEFSWAVDDYLLGITHAIRGKELMIEGEMQNYIWDIFKWKKTNFIYTGLVKLEGIAGKLSKSKSQKEVLRGEYSGWDDPRTWSVQSLEKRGILQESLREFVENIGLNQNDVVAPVDDLYAINRRKLDSDSNRYFFVENPVELKIENFPDVKEIKVKVHPEKPKLKTIELGKSIFVSNKDFNDFNGKEVRLMHLFNVKLDKKTRFTSMENNPGIKKVHWVSQGVKTKVMMPSGAWAFGLAEKSIEKLKKGEIIQFERFGFCKYQGKDKLTGEYEFWYTHN